MKRQIRKVHIPSGFNKSFQRIPVNIQNLAIKKDQQFRLNAFSKQLHTHKLKGELEGFWSYSVNFKYRVMFRFIKNDEVVYYDIGTHDIYK